MDRFTKALSFDGTAANYQRWKSIVAVWETITSVEDNKRGCHVIMHLTGTALDRALELPDKTLKNILLKFDEVYGQTNQLLTKYEEFDEFKRDGVQTMKEYVYTFEQKASELNTLGLKIPDIMLAVKLAKAANLPDDDLRMIKLTIGSNMTLKKVKECLLSLDDKTLSNVRSSSSSKSEDLIKVKQEPPDLTFYADNCSGDYNNIFYYNNHINTGYG